MHKPLYGPKGELLSPASTLLEAVRELHANEHEVMKKIIQRLTCPPVTLPSERETPFYDQFGRKIKVPLDLKPLPLSMGPGEVFKIY